MADIYKMDYDYLSAESVYDRTIGASQSTINGHLIWKYFSGVLGTGSINISNLSFNELFVQVDVGETGNKAFFTIPNIVLSSSSVYLREGGYNGTSAYQNVIIEVSSSAIKLTQAYLNGQTYTNSSRILVYYR